MRGGEPEPLPPVDRAALLAWVVAKHRDDASTSMRERQLLRALESSLRGGRWPVPGCGRDLD